MPSIFSADSNRRSRGIFSFFSKFFPSLPPVTSGGRKTAERSRLPLISSWPARTDGAHDSSPELLHPLSLGTASPLSEVLTPNAATISEVAPQLPALGLGPEFDIDFDAVPGWGNPGVVPGLPDGNLWKRFEFRPSGLDSVNSGCMC